MAAVAVSFPIFGSHYPITAARHAGEEFGNAFLLRYLGLGQYDWTVEIL
jgi:hypothetical protein